MPLNEAELAAQTTEVVLPTDPAELAKLRGDHVGEPPAAPAGEAAKVELSDTDKAEVAAVVEDPAKETAAEEPPRDPETGKFIPKARFDQLREKKDAKIHTLEARLEEATEQLRIKEGPQSVQEAEGILETKVEKYQELLADGKLKEAKDVFKEISQLNRQIAKLEMTPVLRDLTAASINASSVDEVVELYTTEFPEFRTGAPEHNQAMVDQVAELQAGFQALGHTPAAALRKAADIVIKAEGLVPSVERAAAAKAKGKEKPVTVDKGAERKADAVKAAVAAAGAQPPALANLGTDSDKIGASKIDVTALTQEEFAKLPESMIKRLRGDLL
jgi:hypothetical protein